MKRSLLAVASVAAAIFTLPAFAADVGVSISVGQPGFYGRIDVGNFPPPQLIYRQPVMVKRAPAARPPIYLRVPPGHAKHWRKHCHEYNACNERVYFVQDSWYSREYVPRYQEQHGHSQDEHRGNSAKDNRKNHENKKNERHGKERD